MSILICYVVWLVFLKVNIFIVLIYLVKKKFWSIVYCVKKVIVRILRNICKYILYVYKFVWSFWKIFDYDVFYEFWVRNYKRGCVFEE